VREGVADPSHACCHIIGFRKQVISDPTLESRAPDIRPQSLIRGNFVGSDGRLNSWHVVKTKSFQGSAIKRKTGESLRVPPACMQLPQILISY